MPDTSTFTFRMPTSVGLGADALKTAINRLIAERVMAQGPRPVRVRGSTESASVWGPNSGLSDGVYSAEELTVRGAPPDYVTEFSAAWLVWQHLLLTPGRILELKQGSVGATVEIWEMPPLDWIPMICRVSARDISPARAICRAALLLVGGAERFTADAGAEGPVREDGGPERP